jgi:hypothetical protein
VTELCWSCPVHPLIWHAYRKTSDGIYRLHCRSRTNFSKTPLSRQLRQARPRSPRIYCHISLTSETRSALPLCSTLLEFLK